MGLKGLSERIRKRRVIKKTEKLKRKFSFLIEMITAEHIRILDEMQSYEKKVNSVLTEIHKKTDEILEVYQMCQENMGRDLERLENITCNSISINSEKVISTVNEGVSTVRNDIVSSNMILEGKTTGISLSIDEVKTLMKIVAVNNLIDEI